MFLVDSPARRLSEKLLSKYFSKKLIIPGTIIHRMKNTGVSLVKGLFSRIYIPIPQGGNDNVNDGVVDSLRYLLSHENFIKPYSNEHILGVLLTKAFWYVYFPSCCCPAIWDFINYVFLCLYYFSSFLCIYTCDYIVCVIVCVCCTHFLEFGGFNEIKKKGQWWLIIHPWVGWPRSPSYPHSLLSHPRQRQRVFLYITKFKYPFVTEIINKFSEFRPINSKFESVMNTVP